MAESDCWLADAENSRREDVMNEKCGPDGSGPRHA